MMRFLSALFFGKELGAVLDKTKTVRVDGIRFKIRKVNVLDYLAGNKVMLQAYDTYKTGLEPQAPDEKTEKKLKEHYAQVLVAGVVHPRLTLKEDGEGIFVDKLFIDWDLTLKLYNEIMVLTYGKKKVRQFQSSAVASSKRTS